ncbi:hypothetical protein ACFQY7_19115 [Actinomadura luteofluorescens]|uniref:cupin domain-containing protein n=1 Tax=Actinomadura luteofluorescens TaxID=46163 RepID=UPI003629FD3A
MPTLVDTSDHPARDQADFWRHLISSAFGPFHVQPRLPGGFAARLSGRALGPVEAGDVYAPAHAVRRSARQIARDTRECYKLGLVLRGSCVLRQNGRRAVVGAGDVVFYDLTRPVEIAFDAHHIFTVVIPHSAVPLPRERLAAFGGTLLGGRGRTGRLVSSFLAALAESGEEDAARNGPRPRPARDRARRDLRPPPRRRAGRAGHRRGRASGWARRRPRRRRERRCCGRSRSGSRRACTTRR